MAEVEIRIGGRRYHVACQDGEEPYLEAAARLLDAEASRLADQKMKLPEPRMLLMAGLMLADRTVALEEELAALKARVAEAEKKAAEAGEREATARRQLDEEKARARVLEADLEAARAAGPVIEKVEVEKIVEVEKVVEKVPARLVTMLESLAAQAEDVATEADALLSIPESQLDDEEGPILGSGGSEKREAATADSASGGDVASGSGSHAPSADAGDGASLQAEERD